MDELYVNIYDYKNPEYPFCIIVGSRGCGKTFSALRGLDPERGEVTGNMLFMRRTQEELDTIAGEGSETDDSLQPFVSINELCGTELRFARNKKNYDILSGYEDPIFRGKAAALSTMHKVRGSDFSKYSDMVLDEAIGEGHLAKRRGEASALLHAYETVCRNREFDGAPPVNLWIISNSDQLYNEFFIELNIINDIEDMVRFDRGEDLYIPERKLQVHLMRGSEEFQEKKGKTALAALTEGTKFGKMAFHNEFAYNDFSSVEKIGISGWRPVASFDKNYFLYSRGDQYYFSYARANVQNYPGNLAGIMGFKRAVGVWMIDEIIRGRVKYQTYEIKETMQRVIMEGKYGY